MGAIRVLRNEYPGDTSWRRLVDVFRPEWQQCADRHRYLAEFGDEEVAIVLFGSFAEHAIAWFNGEVPALEERTPADVLRNEPQGLRIIKSLLMRLPR